MTTYRVDRNNSKTATPVGMDSILYLGESKHMAELFFTWAFPGIDLVGRPNSAYGVTMSEWRGQSLTGEYVVIKHKGFDDGSP